MSWLKTGKAAKESWRRYPQLKQVETFRPGQPRTETHNAPGSCSLARALWR